jgi:hypothetical protein
MIHKLGQSAIACKTLEEKLFSKLITVINTMNGMDGHQD